MRTLKTNVYEYLQSVHLLYIMGENLIFSYYWACMFGIVDHGKWTMIEYLLTVPIWSQDSSAAMIEMAIYLLGLILEELWIL